MPSDAMPVPPTLTSYLPVLLVSVTHSAAPDDSSFSTLPEGQVDYLSHEWREEDVWRSWRSMTRQKNAIANGMRLENASWRTWWKQRNKLKTISPETLNWLKDSDVTWLYGPLHIGSNWTPSSNKPDSLSALQRKTSLEEISPSKKKQTTAPYAKKPILKRRSIGQLLSLPASPFFTQIESDDEECADLEHEGAESSTPTRPPLLHTKSDTHISWRGRPYRKVSPPRIIAEETPLAPLSTTPGTSDGSDQDLSGSSSTGADGSGVSSAGAKKKHISFNTFVEQCIAIEKPKLKRSSSGPRVCENYDDGYEEDSEVGYDDEDDGPASFYIEHRDSPAGSDSDDDDDVIEMRTSSSRSRSSSTSSSRSPRFSTVPLPGSKDPSPTGSSRSRPGLPRRASAGGERFTIAPIAPTMLKSTGVGNELMGNYGKGRATGAPKEVELVYVPPSHSSYSHPNTPAFGSHEDVYHHRESYFSIGTSGPRARIPSVDALPPPYQAQVVTPGSDPHHHGVFVHSPIVGSPVPMHTEMGGQDAALEDAYDYFEGPDLGEDFGDWRSHMGRRRQSRREQREREEDGAGVVRYSEGGAASVTKGRSSGPDVPVVVVNEVNGAMEERTERSRSASPALVDIDQTVVHAESAGFLDRPHSATHPIPIAAPPAVPVPRLAASPHIAISPQSASISVSAPVSGSTDPLRLSPPEAALCRGRPSSASGSTTTGSFSRSSDSASRSDSRGRSLTRTPSFDHDRSSSRGTSSPIGSISPTSSSLGIAASAYASRGRDREARGGLRSGRADGERGRDRAGRKLGDSMSPPSVLSSPTRSVSDIEYQPYSPTLVDAVESPIERHPPSPPSSVSGSSTASVSTAGTAREAEAGSSRPRLSLGSAHARTSASAVPIPSPIPEEDEQRSRHPTPANSPITTFHPMGHARHESASAPSPSKEKSPIVTLPHPAPWLVTPPAIDTPSPALESPHADRTHKAASARAEQQSGTLVGRAVEMVTSARGFLGSIWNTAS
ncbi:hypothetical protein CERSUDRAFT_112904 [Gelatoporia subvermispora B]|uniref:Nitrogen regulatory protein areA GATA-like domain-containing protein n=1 Tax=Ceriporiopsis subvermispora (strain B) TaxID=914234 RepID=M2R3X3_CERS8|nr:hypothetical protein CERSUDRAFT_112904 [Gelatoporia subvermispora B]